MGRYHTKKEVRGSVLLESILGISLVTLFMLILIGSTTYLMRNALSANHHTEALLLAQEGLEATRNIRDENYTQLTDGAHGLTQNAGLWEFIGMAEQGNIFTRTITVEHENASTTQVGVRVTWGEGNASSSVEIETILTDWRNQN